MSDLGFGAGGVSEGLQLIQSLQTGKIEQQQKQVALEQSQLQLENMKKLTKALGSQAFGEAMSGDDPNSQNKALMQLADTYLASDMPQQARSVVDMATTLRTTRAYETEQNAMASSRIWGMAGDLLGGATDSTSWNQGLQMIQSQLTPEQMARPEVKKLLSTPYSPDLVRMMPKFSEHMKDRAQALADTARADRDEAERAHFRHEDKHLDALSGEAEAHADYYRAHGAGALLPSKEEVTAAANDLQTRFPEAETEPVVQAGGVTDSTATRANYKARVQSAANIIADAAKEYTRQGMKPADARRRAIEEADARGDLTVLKPPPGPKRAVKPAAAASPAGPAPAAPADAWGQPSIVDDK